MHALAVHEEGLCLAEFLKNMSNGALVQTQLIIIIIIILLLLLLLLWQYKRLDAQSKK